VALLSKLTFILNTVSVHCFYAGVSSTGRASGQQKNLLHINVVVVTIFSFMVSNGVKNHCFEIDFSCSKWPIHRSKGNKLQTRLAHYN